MYEIKCTIEGLVEVLYNRPPMEIPGGRAPKKRQTNREALLKEKIYVDRKGVYMPVDNIEMMLIGSTARTGAAKILGSYIETNKGTEYTNFCKGCIWITALDGSKKLHWQPNRKTWDGTDVRSFPDKSQQRHTAERPMIKTPWKLTFVIHVTEDTWSPDMVKRFFDVAGMRVGLGSYGPKFGRFLVKEFVDLRDNVDYAKSTGKKSKKKAS